MTSRVLAAIIVLLAFAPGAAAARTSRRLPPEVRVSTDAREAFDRFRHDTYYGIGALEWREDLERVPVLAEQFARAYPKRVVRERLGTIYFVASIEVGGKRVAALRRDQDICVAISGKRDEVVLDAMDREFSALREGQAPRSSKRGIR